jgi:hypothetical protein
LRVGIAVTTAAERAMNPRKKLSFIVLSLNLRYNKYGKYGQYARIDENRAIYIRESILILGSPKG